jgi:hypothetical protein
MLERGLTNPPQRIWSSRPKPRMTDHLQHTLIGASRQGPFSKECRHVLHGVSHGPNARCGSARGHRGWGRKLSRVLSFVHHANRLSVCMYVSRVCLSVCLVWSVRCRSNQYFLHLRHSHGPQRRCAGKLVSQSQLRRSIYGIDN